jgi:GTP-binding protein
VGLGDNRTIVVADIPGIIEDAHLGRGLGLTFLQHVERTRVLAYPIPLDEEDVQAVYDRLRHEIGAYSGELLARGHLVVLTKRDILPPDAELPAVRAPDARGVVVISSASGAGLPALKERLWEMVHGARREESLAGAEDEADAGG